MTETFPFEAKKKWGQNKIDFFCIFCFDLIYFDMVFHKQVHIFLTRNSPMLIQEMVFDHAFAQQQFDIHAKNKDVLSIINRVTEKVSTDRCTVLCIVMVAAPNQAPFQQCCFQGFRAAFIFQIVFYNCGFSLLDLQEGKRSQKLNICIHLVFSPCKNEKGSYDELESDASQGFCDRIIVSAFSGNSLFFFFFWFSSLYRFQMPQLIVLSAGSVILYMICSG